jgi:hypothetical protein
MYNNTPTLHEVIKNSYAKTKSPQLGGYKYDAMLSNHNHQTYYNPKERKLLFSVTGSHNASDWLNNIKLGLGVGFKESNRYKESHKALRDAKKKYNINNATVVGHSQGGFTAQHISSGGDKVLTLDKAATIGGKLKSGDHYRTGGDLVSALEIGKTHTKTLDNPHSGSLLKTVAKAGLAYATANPLLALSAAHDVLKSHDVDNIKNNKIFV